ncbi:MAG: guanylate kinase [Oscillospiraceae bacterium]|nr:guanylate kinase [Oscillospiraceae bacterium]
MTRGKLYVLSGPSGVGKSTAVHEVMRRHPSLRFSVSVTTREMRPGEVEGESYYFITRRQFQEMLERNELLEHAEYVGNCYGTPEGPINRMLEDGVDVLLDIEPCGALQVQQRRPDATLIFMAAPSFSEIERRLRGRGDTAQDKIEARLERARWEYQQAQKYDYIVVNDDVGHAAAEIEAIMLAEKCRAHIRLDYLKEER